MVHDTYDILSSPVVVLYIHRGLVVEFIAPLNHSFNLNLVYSLVLIISILIHKRSTRRCGLLELVIDRLARMNLYLTIAHGF